jgi:acetoin utilization deacetylase AcuC-like enzyme
MRNFTFMVLLVVSSALSAAGCLVRERPVAYHHVGPPPHHAVYRDDRGYRDRGEYRYYR